MTKLIKIKEKKIFFFFIFYENTIHMVEPKMLLKDFYIKTVLFLQTGFQVDYDYKALNKLNLLRMSHFVTIRFCFSYN